MGDLVVAEKHRVDHRSPAVEILDRGRHLQLALEDVRVRAKQGVREPATVHTRLDLQTSLLRLLPDLRHDLLDHEDERAGHVVGIGEEREVVLTDASLALLAHGAHRDHRVRCVTRDEVRPAGPVRVQQALAVRVPLLDLPRVLRAVRDERFLPVLLPPAEARHVPVRALQDPRLHRSGLRRPVTLPLDHRVGAVAQPGGHRRRASVPHRPHEHVVREPVDLQKQDPRNVARRRRFLRLSRVSLDHLAVVEIVVVDPQEQRHHVVDQRQAERNDDRRPQPADLHRVGEDIRGQPDEDAVQEEHPESERDHSQRQRYPDQQRPDERIQQPEHRRQSKAAPPALDRETLENPGQQHQRHRVDHPADDHAAEPQRPAPIYGSV